MSSPLKLVPFQVGHLDLMKLRDVFPHQGAKREQYNLLANNLNFHSVTIFKGETPIAVIGLIPIWDGVAEAWSLTTDRIKDCGISFHRLVKRVLSGYEGVLKLHRIQMTVKADFWEGVRWAEALGFQRECLMNEYGPNKENYYLYARTKAWALQQLS